MVSKPINMKVNRLDNKYPQLWEQFAGEVH